MYAKNAVFRARVGVGVAALGGGAGGDIARARRAVGDRGQQCAAALGAVVLLIQQGAALLNERVRLGRQCVQIGALVHALVTNCGEALFNFLQTVHSFHTSKVFCKIYAFLRRFSASAVSFAASAAKAERASNVVSSYAGKSTAATS